MIRFSLSCPAGHIFDSWFASSAAYEKLQSAALVQCPDCGSREVSKALMAPAVAPSDVKAPKPDLAALREKIESSADYVGLSFATEARAMHDGEVPDRPIYGEARLDEARSLLADGIPVMPLPFIPKRQTN